ncbi:MAG: hypothetical protein J2P31_16510 [Blastocatellia bacterium]|nr:hypothetical protein [Blastocatellia bacterium]
MMLMNYLKSLEKTFHNYLLSELEKEAAIEMYQVLGRSGLHDESKALETYLEASSISPSCLGELDWDQRKCYAGKYPPPKPNLGEVWFDVVELTPMLLIPGIDEPSVDHACWIAMHPVYRWQFKGFLSCMKLGRVITQVPSAPDYLSAVRFEGEGKSEYITDVYHDEALAYAYWFGKFITDQFELSYARHYLDDDEFSMVLPPKMRLWDETEFPASEFVRTAFGSDTLNKEEEDQYAEFLLRKSGENKNLPDRTVYEEWERRGDIGFSTSVPLQIGMIDDLPRETLFFRLENAAPR